MKEGYCDGGPWGEDPELSVLNTKPWGFTPSQKEICVWWWPGNLYVSKLLGNSDDLTTLTTTDLGWSFPCHEGGGLMEEVF